MASIRDFVHSKGFIEVPISRERIQAVVDKQLPWGGSFGPFSYKITSALVALRPDGRVSVTATLRSEAIGRAAEGQIIASGVITYEAGEFYLKDFQSENVTLSLLEGTAGDNEKFEGAKGWLGGVMTNSLVKAGMSGAANVLMDDMKTRLVEAASGIIARNIEGRSIYSLNNGDMKHKLARLVLKDIRVEGGSLIVRLYTLRHSLPALVYVAGAALAAAIGGGYLIAVTH